jgi:competence protein ComEC
MTVQRVRMFLFFLLVVTLGIRVLVEYKKPNPNPIKDKDYICHGTVIEEPEYRDTSLRLIVECGGFRMLATVDRFTDVEYLDTVNVRGVVSPAKFKGYNDYYINFAKVEVVSHGSSLVKKLFSLKYSFLNNLKQVLGEPHASLAGGLVVGEKSALGQELLDDFRHAGLIHIVVLSGFNITVIADALMRLLIFFPLTIRVGIGAVGMVLFSLLVGGGATVIRSTIMALIMLLSKIAGKQYVALQGLFIAGVSMGIYEPKTILYDASFHLSFLATLAMILLAPWIEKKLIFLPERFEFRGIISSTIATQIFVSPYLIYLMGSISFWGLVTNIFVLPVIPPTMLFIFLSGVTGWVSYWLSFVLAIPAYMLLSYELFVVRLFSI